ncbi:flagellar biosynthesis protein FlhB [Legionella worsleiensis]|uniref:Flagellar biosynthetic protein FlhB n=1 Tax=Legionella worsleiensis TaxID=45076 RepID=A0A0W1A5Y4_9GAMM|nr:EscU/YscU/HrcU family type III secretion system export apparatus switch protein [Legionella worsleiensis]KTD76765.1 flagellar biosynthetic protein FlhB [Legionella worsleiensis]STY30583.1 flagellar biosynthetic protein FlhB [Legionella worsleiensis]
MSEKTEQPTSYKLQKAKEKGQASKSIELTTCIALFVMLGMISALWPRKLQELKLIFKHILNLAGHARLNTDNIIHLHQFILAQLINLWLPFALASGLTIVLCSLAQTGIIWSTVPLTPDFKRLSLTQGFKKLFSIKTGVDALKNSCKLGLTFLVLLILIKTHLPHILSLTRTSPLEAPEFMMSFLIKMALPVLTMLLVIAFFDRFFMRWKFHKDQRMSKQDIKDEYKQREGDPKIKSKIKQLQHQLRQKTNSLSAVKHADVVVTNPTHIAIALQYDRNSMPAPKVVCKATGEMVGEVKKIARKFNIPIIEHKPLARILYQTIELNQWISKDLYPATAAVFRELYDLGRRHDC